MEKYGIENVRGGTLTKEKLNKEEYNSICILFGRKYGILSNKIKKKMKWAAINLCRRCGINTYWELNCYAKLDIEKEKI